MPTENEQKFVLRLGCEDEIKEASNSTTLCKQAYLAFTKGMSLRIRESVAQNHSSKPKYKLCFKQKVDGRVIEVEKKIDRRDFDDLWKVALNRLEKTRYNLWFDDYLWEVDFFRDSRHMTYFVLAEHEMPEGQMEPDFIPEIIQKNLVYAAAIEDSRFASKRLADVKYAKTTYQELLETCEYV